MRTPRRPSRLVAAAAAAGLVLAPSIQAAAETATATATAQAMPPASGDAAMQAGADLPSRVGRLARLSGTVSFHTADEDHWDPATLNYPVTSGDAFWTEPQASAAIEVAASRIDMAGTTEFDVEQLDDHALTATQAQGETFLDLRDLQPGETVTIRTPRGSVAITTSGQYEVAAGDTQAPTTVTVLSGAAQLSGDALAQTVAAGQTATIIGSGGAGDAFQGSVGVAQRDSFMVAELAAASSVTADASVSARAPAPIAAPAEAPITAPVDGPVTARASASATVTASAPAAVRQMPGGRELSSYGDWQESSQYGQVWYPRVQQDWVPYRQGHWAYVAPWGWTWIDEEPWGYAPFHYGRWVQVEDRWAWAPVYFAPGFAVPAFYRPIYAPALVGFFGFGAGLAAGLAIGGGIGFGLGFGGFGYGHIGWCPLGWGEPFRPWFGGRGYFDRVNRFDVANIRNVTYNNSVHNVTINNFANAGRGATVVPTAAMLASRRAASSAEPFSRAQFAQAHPVSTVPHPTAGTAGVTPHVAERLGLAGAGAAAAHAAAGPRIGSAGGGLPLRTAAAGQTAAARTAAPGVHAVGGTQSHLPALRSGGAPARAGGGAPGPAITPRVSAQAGRLGGVNTADAARHGAPGPAITHARTTAAAGTAGAVHGGLPPLRSHAVAGSPRSFAPGATSHPPGVAAAHPSTFSAAIQHQPASRLSPQTPRLQPVQHAAVTPASRYQAPQTSRYQAPQTQRSQAPQASHYQPQRYQAPQPNRYQAPQTPRYQAPQLQHYQTPQMQHYQAPRYQAPQMPHYQAPQMRAPAFAAPQRQFSAPARPAPTGKRPWPP